MTAPVHKQYRKLVAAPGEAYIPRYDLLGKVANSARTSTRRSLVYMGHFTDIHMIDSQTPARVDVMAGQDANMWAGVARPQETMQINTLTQMTVAMNAAKESPVTGAAMAGAVTTGDNTDQISSKELQWYMGVLDGGTYTPNSGAAGEYQGVQKWANTFAYHPDDPSQDNYGWYGFPTIPGLLEKVVSQKVESPGLAVPWFTVFGNHDTLINGVIPADAGFHAYAIGDRKAAQWQALAGSYLRGMGTDASPFTQFTNRILTQWQRNSDMEQVTADGERKLYDQATFIAAHLGSPDKPGPVGHGFTQDNLDNVTTYWKADLSSNVRLFGLDTCNQVTGADGAVPQDQFDWLKEELGKARDEKKLAMVLSHHNSFTLENPAQPVFGGTPLVHAEEFIAMLQEFPNMVAWVNGHTHINTITAHKKPNGTGGFWEITSASCVDYPQQQQLIELVDNRDGTMSIFATTLDHASDATWKNGDFSVAGLASLSREMGANDWIANPAKMLGSPLDRNTELLLPAPFDLSGISDATLQKDQATAKARILAFDRSQPK
ncbi:MAG: TIGR03767 family metallophosphoesterase [Candidatus Nanopelagicales bacterium]